MEIKKYPFTLIPGWSYSRSRTLRECPRRYWFSYYGENFGDAEISKKIKRLKQLTALPIEVGGVIHQTIGDALKEVLMRGEMPSEEKLILRGHIALKILLESQKFIENELGEGLDEKRIADAFEKIKSSLSTFYSHPLLPEIISSLEERSKSCLVDPAGYGECRIDKKKVYAKSDLIYIDDKGQTKVVDWKTGKPNREENLIQLGGYLFYAVDHLDHSIDNLEGRMIYLDPPDDDFILKPTEESLGMIKQRIMREIEGIEECCSDVENNIPKSMKHFPKTVDTHFCLYCKYNHFCDKYD